MMDDRFFMYSEESEWCWRVKQAGFKVRYNPDIKIMHYGAVSTGQISPWKSVEIARGHILFLRFTRGPVIAWVGTVIMLFGDLLRAVWFLPVTLLNPQHQGARAWRARTVFLLKALISPPRGQTPPKSDASSMKSLAKSLVRSTVHTVLAPIEARMLARQPAAQWPHVFILGAPRSGTSLFYELMVTGFKFAYFSNLAHRFYKTPLAASRLGQRLLAPHEAAYKSDYGHISGWAAPNEGGWIWQRWLEDGPWADEHMLSSLPASEIQATLAGMSAISEAPFINKNVMHSNRVRLLDALFPGCLFIEVQRDAKDTARSIIRAQRRDKGPKRNRDEWWSVRPSNAGGDTLIERACRQVTGVAQDIARDCAFVGPDRLLSINYSSLCAKPQNTLADVAHFLGRHNVPAISRSPVPAQFNLHPSKSLTSEEEAHLGECLQIHTKAV